MFADVLRIIDELEQTFEKGSAMLGKRFVNEEEFFTHIQRLRSSLATAAKEVENGSPSETSIRLSDKTPKSVTEFIEDSRGLSRQSQLQVVASITARLANE